jgi:hypothetical protein
VFNVSRKIRCIYNTGPDTSFTRAETLSDHLRPEPVPQEAVDPLKALTLFAVDAKFKPALEGSSEGLEECVDEDLDNKLKPVLQALVSAEFTDITVQLLISECRT